MHTDKRPVSTHQNNCKILTKAKQSKATQSKKKFKKNQNKKVSRNNSSSKNITAKIVDYR